MVRLFSMFVAVVFMSMAYIGSSYADSDSDDKSKYKYEKKHDKGKNDYRRNHKDDKSNNRRDSRSEEKGNRYNSNRDGVRLNDPINQNIDRTIGHANKIERKINQAREWWQFW